jgi:hypothetical protein
VWSALSVSVGAVGTWMLGFRQTRTSIETEQIKASMAVLASEHLDRDRFRAALMAEIKDLRIMVSECEADRADMRAKIHDMAGEIAVLTASQEITRRWLEFFKEKLPPGHTPAG